MQIANVIAGFSLGQADLLRRAMGKKKKEILDKMEVEFHEGAKKKDVDKAVAQRLWNLIYQFAGYGFNKSHSAAYAVITYRTAYLKAHYPGAFLASLLTTDMNDTNKVVKYINDADDFGFELLPPDINESNEDFTVTEEGIRFGLAAIKNVGAGAVRGIIKERDAGGPYKSLANFCERAEPGLISRALLENLIRAGAFDCLDYTRATLLNAYPAAFERAQGILKDKAIGQGSLFDDFDEDEAPPEEKLEDLPELDKNEILKDERRFLGIYITGHPLNEYTTELHLFATDKVTDLFERKEPGKTRLVGIATNVKKKKIKSGDRMAVFTLEDRSGSVEVAVMPSLLEQREEILKDEEILIVEGTASQRGDQFSVRADKILTLEEGWNHYVNQVQVSFKAESLDDDRLFRLKGRLIEASGAIPVILHVNVPGAGIVQYELEPTFKVQPSRELKLALEDLFQEGAVTFKKANGRANGKSNGRGNGRRNG